MVSGGLLGSVYISMMITIRTVRRAFGSFMIASNDRTEEMYTLFVFLVLNYFGALSFDEVLKLISIKGKV